jgi:hypothetical protein
MILNGEYPGVLFSGSGGDGASGNQGGKGGLGGERPKPAANLVQDQDSEPEPDGSSGTKNPKKTSTALSGSRPRDTADGEAPEPAADH